MTRESPAAKKFQEKAAAGQYSVHASFSFSFEAAVFLRLRGLQRREVFKCSPALAPCLLCTAQKPKNSEGKNEEGNRPTKWSPLPSRQRQTKNKKRTPLLCANERKPEPTFVLLGRQQAPERRSYIPYSTRYLRSLHTYNSSSGPSSPLSVLSPCSFPSSQSTQLQTKTGQNSSLSPNSLLSSALDSTLSPY